MSAPFSLAADARIAYLKGLGVKTPGDAVELDRLYRGLVAPESERAALRARLNAVGVEGGAMALLARVFGSASEVGGVIVIGAAGEAKAAARLLADIRASACANVSQCPFWNPTTLRKVAAVPVADLAGYLPETRALMVSRALLREPNRLSRFVVVHELTHAALEGIPRWEKEWAKLSGWRRAGGGWKLPAEPTWRPYSDELTRLSTGSPFSLLPDARARGVAGGDGFPVAKGVRAVEESGELAEELADAVAAAVVAPERFCLEKEALAPRKYAWLTRHILGAERALKCQGSPGT